MYKNNRLKQIQSFLELHGSVDISALSRELGVSEMTIRRDLSILVSRGTAVRTHGGAILPRERYLGRCLYGFSLSDQRCRKEGHC